jgi:NlpC/P60 family putative phage cell wall peptidase
VSAPSVPRSIDAERAAVVAEARSWIGTPYHMGARVKGAGVDCAQLLVAVYETLALVEPVELEPYHPEWFLHRSDELFLAGIAGYCHRVGGLLTKIRPGDIVLYRYGRAVSHGAIAVGADLVVHAVRQAQRVTLEESGPGSLLSGRLDSVWRINRWAGEVR